MPDERPVGERPGEERGGGLGKSLGHKLGPLPTWAWIAIGGLGFALLARRGGGGARGGGGGQLAPDPGTTSWQGPGGGQWQPSPIQLPNLGPQMRSGFAAPAPSIPIQLPTFAAPFTNPIQLPNLAAPSPVIPAAPGPSPSPSLPPTPNAPAAPSWSMPSVGPVTIAQPGQFAGVPAGAPVQTVTSGLTSIIVGLSNAALGRGGLGSVAPFTAPPLPSGPVQATSIVNPVQFPASGPNLTFPPVVNAPPALPGAGFSDRANQQAALDRYNMWLAGDKPGT